jgi:hypothetical protein
VDNLAIPYRSDRIVLKNSVFTALRATGQLAASWTSDRQSPPV